MRITCPPVLKSLDPSRASLVRYSLYNLNKIGDKQHSFINLVLFIPCIVLARMGEERGVYRVLVGKPEGKRPLGRPRRRWKDNIKMDLQEVGGSCGDWMELAQDRDRWQALVGTVRNLRVPKRREIS